MAKTHFNRGELEHFRPRISIRMLHLAISKARVLSVPVALLE
jgi:hypothetical protein